MPFSFFATEQLSYLVISISYTILSKMEMEGRTLVILKQ